MIKRIVLICSLIIASTGFSQDLFKERIRKIDSRKKSIYHGRGIFSYNGKTKDSSLVKIRHKFKKKLGFERIVFDFSTSELPKIYSYISQKESKLYIDIFGTTLSRSIGAFGETHFVNSIDVFPMKENQITLELQMKKNASVDLFYLQNPARLVVDVKL